MILAKYFRECEEIVCIFDMFFVVNAILYFEIAHPDHQKHSEKSLSFTKGDFD